ncbi:hypothetical protein GCM10011507_33520 [Edaphobacter acidisoli]|uniref:Uncharacterized protein n=1 Tax=Edaphobacter acidisoli TaxID=2040573 RepID=A0A916S0X8_9BACT|nr:hypothetical protein GCM10011507_33520 [Edaphobacter acidisoli]
MPLSDYPEDEIVAEAFRILRERRRSAKPKNLKPCPKCGKLFGVREMRIHIPRCELKEGI